MFPRLIKRFVKEDFEILAHMHHFIFKSCDRELKVSYNDLLGKRVFISGNEVLIEDIGKVFESDLKESCLELCKVLTSITFQFTWHPLREGEKTIYGISFES